MHQKKQPGRYSCSFSAHDCIDWLSLDSKYAALNASYPVLQCNPRKAEELAAVEKVACQEGLQQMGTVGVASLKQILLAAATSSSEGLGKAAFRLGIKEADVVSTLESTSSVMRWARACSYHTCACLQA